MAVSFSKWLRQQTTRQDAVGKFADWISAYLDRVSQLWLADRVLVSHTFLPYINRSYPSAKQFILDTTPSEFMRGNFETAAKEYIEKVNPTWKAAETIRDESIEPVMDDNPLTDIDRWDELAGW